MAFCDFIEKGEHCVCRLCDRKMRRIPGVPLEKHFAECRTGGRRAKHFTHQRKPCIYEGEFLETGTERADAPPPGCGDCRKMIAVFECEIHDVCTPVGVAKDKSIKSCDNCDEKIIPEDPSDGNEL